MNQDQMEGIRRQVAGRIKETWGQLTRDKSMTIAGRRDQLIGKLQERHGYSEVRNLESASPARMRKLDESVNRAFDDLKRNFE